VVAEHGHDLLGLAQPQQPVVDEDAGELVADRLVDQDGGDRLNRPRPTGRRSPPSPTCARILRDGLLAVGAHRPVAGEARERTKFS
jgi:hypothetical protein